LAIDQKDFVVYSDESRCDGCRLCMPACSHGALLSAPGERKPYIDRWSCTGCGSCTTVCPQQALQFQKRGNFS